jgi:hypothetical protein
VRPAAHATCRASSRPRGPGGVWAGDEFRRDSSDYDWAFRAGTPPLRPALDLAVTIAKARLAPVMTAVRRILDHKGHQVWSVHPDDTVYDAIKMMADKDVGALVVLHASVLARK